MMKIHCMMQAGGGNDYVKQGDNHIHVATFLQRFLFGREMLDQHVGALSGGEQARILLAKLILQGANLLVWMNRPMILIY